MNEMSKYRERRIKVVHVIFAPCHLNYTILSRFSCINRLRVKKRRQTLRQSQIHQLKHLGFPAIASNFTLYNKELLSGCTNRNKQYTVKVKCHIGYIINRRLQSPVFLTLNLLAMAFVARIFKSRNCIYVRHAKISNE